MKLNRLILIVLIFICFFNNEFTLGLIDKTINLDVFTKIIIFISLFVVVLNYQFVFKRFKIWLVILIIMLLSLVIQSQIEYHVLFVYPHVYFKLLIIFVLFATYTLASKIEANYLDLFSKIIILFYLFDLFMLGWINYYSPLSLFDVDPSIGGAGDSRVFHANIVYLFILPFLYYYAKYLKERKSNFLALSIIIGLILLFQNHRSIWVSAAIALLSLTYLYIKSVASSRYFSIGIIIPITAISLTIFFGIVFYKGTSIFEERLSDIINWRAQGTGLWRYEQVESYLPFIYNNIIWGLRFGGFEFPTLGPASGSFQSGTGHHFHNGIIDIIFYHGLIGLFLVYGIIIFILYKLYRKKNKDLTDIISFSFLFAAIPFSFAYALPLAFWGITGVMATFTSIDNIRKGINRKKSIAANKNVYIKHI